MNKCLISFFLLLSVFWLCCPLTKAYTYDEFMQFVSDINDANIGNTSFLTYFLSKNSANKQAFTNNNLNINDYNNWLLWWNSEYNWSLWFFNGTVPDYTVLNDNLFSSITFSPSTSFKYCFSVYNNSYSYINYSNYNKSGNTCLFLFDKDPINGDFKGAVAQNYLVSSLSFEPFPEPTKSLNGVTYYIKSISRTVPMWRLGTLNNISQNGSGKCSAFMDEWVGYWHPFYQPPINNNGNTTAQVYLDNSKVLYNNAYRIRFSDNDNWTDYTYFIFLPYGETFSGDLISGDLLYTGNDNNDNIGLINTIENQYSLNSGEVGLVLDQYLPSGNFLSGDFGMFSEAMGHDYSNSYFDKLYTFYRNILYTLTLTGDVTLNISYRNWSTTLHASDFQVPNNPIKTLVTTLLIVWTIFLFYQQFDKMFRHIATFNLFAFLHDSDVDYHMFL